LLPNQKQSWWLFPLKVLFSRVNSAEAKIKYIEYSSITNLKHKEKNKTKVEREQINWSNSAEYISLEFQKQKERRENV